MTKLTIEMPTVANCAAEDCAYNSQQMCHARAITIGDGAHPDCDTFFMNRSHVLEKKMIAGIGACKVTNCTHNEDCECTASSISVGRSGSAINCMTFKAR